MNSNYTPEVLAYYATQGPMTDPGKYAHLFETLPTNLRELCRLIQNNLLHVFWAERYGRSLSEDEKKSLETRSVAQKLTLLQEINERALVVRRSLNQRQVGNCRDFTLMLISILRYQGIPARGRCGFGTYFLPDHFEDHWVCEYWNKVQERWVLVDPQLDEFQCNELNISFDPLDVPRNQFIVAGQAWQMCRQRQADPQQFGIFELHGWWFIWGNVVRELFAFNKVEILPWDHIPACMTHDLEDPLPVGNELAFYDGLASLTQKGDSAFWELRAVFENDPRFKVPAHIIGS